MAMAKTGARVVDLKSLIDDFPTVLNKAGIFVFNAKGGTVAICFGEKVEIREDVLREGDFIVHAPTAYAFTKRFTTDLIVRDNGQAFYFCHVRMSSYRAV